MPYDFATFDKKVTGAIEWLQKEFRAIRTGRANTAILDNVSVSAYGSMVPLKQVGQIGVEDARTIRVQPYDPSTIKDIERAISAANLGVSTTADASGVRVIFPELTGERRQELVKVAKGKLEESRAAIRVARDEAKKEIEGKARDSELTEDDRYDLLKTLQEKTDKANGDLEAQFEKKNQEVTG